MIIKTFVIRAKERNASTFMVKKNVICEASIIPFISLEMRLLLHLFTFICRRAYQYGRIVYLEEGVPNMKLQPVFVTLRCVLQVTPGSNCLAGFLPLGEAGGSRRARTPIPETVCSPLKDFDPRLVKSLIMKVNSSRFIFLKSNI